MIPFSITIDRKQLFNNICQLTLYATEQMKDEMGVSQVDSYILGETERELYATIDEQAMYDMYDASQILYKGVDTPLTVSAEAFTLKGNIPSNLPVDMVATTMTEALVDLILAKWWETRKLTSLQQEYEQKSEKSLSKLKSRILSRNTNQITYRPY